jgi:hypothetical protein
MLMARKRIELDFLTTDFSHFLPITLAAKMSEQHQTATLQWITPPPFPVEKSYPSLVVTCLVTNFPGESVSRTIVDNFKGISKATEGKSGVFKTLGTAWKGTSDGRSITRQFDWLNERDINGNLFVGKHYAAGTGESFQVNCTSRFNNAM